MNLLDALYWHNDGQLVDKTDYAKYPARNRKDKNEYEIRIIERDGVIYY